MIKDFTKYCIRCGLTKQITEFHKDKNFKSGYKSSCKICLKNKVPVLIIKELLSKICAVCNNKKILEDFPKDKKGKFGRHSYCKNCAKLKRKSEGDSYRVKQKQWRINNYEHYTTYARLWNYKKLGIKITEEEYRILVKEQDNKCALCRTSPKTRRVLCLDHDHKTGKVRGLLCNDCNIGLGKFKDNVEILAKSIVYLSKI